jgi:predicted anti-sigma-YlaC factor YlaD
MKDYPSHGVASGLTCQDVTEGTSEFLDDRLPLIRKVRMSLHLASCVHCRTYIQQIALLSETSRLLPQAVPSPFNRLRLRRHFLSLHGCAS